MIKWNYEKCKQAALMCKTKNEFKKKFYGAVKFSKKNNFFNEIISHMKIIKKEWTKEKCYEEALKYTYKKDFFKYSNDAYTYANRHKFLNEICEHMKVLRKQNGYWTKENCQEEALKYTYKKDFIKNSNSCYNISCENGWIDEICIHMIEVGNRYKRCIYVWEFEDNYAYIGLTYNFKERIRQHKKDKSSSVFKHLKICNGVCKQLTEYLDVELSKEKEKDFLIFYKEKNWNILNIAKTGCVGSGIRKWDYENLKKEALKYNRKIDFKKNSQVAYDTAIKRKIIDKICSHMN
jgi:predicted GIY-YIG superfamily endonuclease